MDEAYYEAVDEAAGQEWEQPGWKQTPELRRLREKIGLETEEPIAPTQITSAAVELTGKDQVRLIQLFKGDAESAKLKRVIAMRYVSHNPSQGEMVAWLQSLKPPKRIPTSWTKIGLVDWEDAFRSQPKLVKSFLSKITGVLRKGGYNNVGRIARRVAQATSKS